MSGSGHEHTSDSLSYPMAGWNKTSLQLQLDEYSCVSGLVLRVHEWPCDAQCPQRDRPVGGWVLKTWAEEM